MQLNREIQPQNVELTVNQNQHVRTPDPPAGSNETVGGTGDGGRGLCPRGSRVPTAC